MHADLITQNETCLYYRTLIPNLSAMSRETPFPVGVVDSLEDKKDEHSTRKRPYNTLGPDTDPESAHGPRKHPHNALGSESELVGEFEDNSTPAQKGNHSPHNSEVSDTQAESEQPGVLQKGYAMMCDVCGVENCHSRYNKPVLMVCYLCNNHGKHWPKNILPFRTVSWSPNA